MQFKLQITTLECAFPLPAVAVQQSRFESTAEDWMASHANDANDPSPGTIEAE
ncbi:hypothetical protein [Xanthomonas vasicola]|uniref:hypothetical protein n=1 Tax=Xanthomonas vasicola TaxID=56459 RepID=UPI0013E0146F|nr:hypothetical protein [Xanthomonas vasicola]MBV7304180.1 hypothetical protein [Xanthomonas vasicola pv. vasculorum]MDO6934556.1 hypothetical protein [Xanthomonas vasicola]MDO6938219.1 hypothetical protein [Xanthomonas vasicola]